MAEWEQAKFTVIPRETLDGINNALNSAISFLDRIDQALDALEALVNILALIESLVNDFFNIVLKGIIDDFLRMVNDFKYTGVYVLDLTSHNWIGNTAKIEPVEIDGLVENWAAGKEPITEDFVIPKPKRVQNVSKVSLEFPRGKDRQFPEFNILTYYKRQTYREWLQVIIDAFEDANDLPSTKAWEDLRRGDTPPKEPLKKTAQQLEIANRSPHPYENAYLRPGRPNFGPTGNINCYVFAFAVGDLLTFLQTLGSFSKVFWNLTNFDEYSQLAEKYKKTAKSLWDGILSEDWDLLPGEYTNQRGEPPDFYGINAAQILQPIFEIIEKLAEKLKSIFKTVETGLSQFLKDTIEALRNQIEELRAVVEVIRQLIRLLSDLLNLNGLYMLHIESKTGIFGIIEELRNATGFKGDQLGPRERSGTRRPKLYIGGALFCYGWPSEDSQNYNLSEAWERRTERFKSKTANINIAQSYKQNTDILRKLMQ